jgi:DNA-directed RNA polymerase specialized sigma24 family protein
MRHRQLNEHRLAATPASETEWLMQPGDRPIEHSDHIIAVAEVIDSLPDAMQDVLLAVFAERTPYSELGERLGCSKTQAWRKAKAAKAELARLLINNPTLLERYPHVRDMG